MGQGRYACEPATLPCHLNDMGRDAMNLVEFPLALLADRAPKGCKTLVFEDRIQDRVAGGYVVRRLTVSGSDRFGLPTALDDEVCLGLLQLTMADHFTRRRIPFNRYQLLRILGWRDEGKSYARLDKSLKRWTGVTLYYENAWRDNRDKRWINASLHLLDEVVLRGRSPVRSSAASHPRISPGMKLSSRASRRATSDGWTWTSTASSNWRWPSESSAFWTSDSISPISCVSTWRPSRMSTLGSAAVTIPHN